MFVIVLDDLNTSFSRTARVKLAARQFIERYLGANDVAAIVQTGGAKATGQEFTEQPRAAAARRQQLHGAEGALGDARPDRRVLPDARHRRRAAGRAIRTRRFASTRRGTRFTVLKNVADYMAGIRGRRKAVVFFSEGIDYDIYNPIANTYATDIRQYSQDAIAAATRANVSFYGVDPRGLTGFDEAAEIASLPDDPSLDLGLIGPAARAADLAGQPAHALRRDRRLCRRQLERLREELRAHHPGQQQLLRARLLLERQQARRAVPQR